MSSLLTSSRLKAARLCQRFHHIQFGLGIRPVVEADVLRFGTLFHKGLEAWWTAPNNRLEAGLAALAGEADPIDRIKAEELLRGYDARWGQDAYQVVAIEAKFETELINPATRRPSQNWRLAGKVDGIVIDNKTRKLLMEHKTTSEEIGSGSTYWQRLRMDLQLSIYFQGAKALGHEVEGCIYDVIKKPKLQPYAATPLESRKYKKDGTLYAAQREHPESPEEFRLRLREAIASDPNAYFQRGEVVRLESEMEEAMYEIWQTAQQIRESELAGRAPRNPDACIRYSTPCPYFDVCSGTASLDDTTRFKKSETNPELSPVEQPKEQVA